MWNQFKKFALKGNVLDLAVGVIIGSAFGKIVTSLVNDMIMPVVGLFLGGVDFSSLSFKYYDAVIKYGAFIQTVVDFFIIAFSVFMFVRFVNHFKRQEEEKAALPVIDKKEELLIEIRDLLREK
ncbi:large conductance mechanosensitive channel protein MscL [Bacillus sp. T33-2]|uniref:large conductance mechanosensitive channel protein MscL n=1 Tax=Bacillus sp. T33-2 TaxID=2054168 RepID=UPI000C77F5B9|nr:large conductance mechanosensitive channel protein MscL [Bacillus sp. T33-2]PLR96086.1 large conductance mechanosensitive channel protein MscL [Bacillus sp. T33-2]